MINFDEVFERIKLATNTRTQVELAEVLDIRQSSISDAKRRNSIPSDWYMKLFEQFGLNPDWLKKGIGPMYLRTDDGYTPVDAPSSAMLCEDSSRFAGADARSTIVTVNSTQGRGQAGEMHPHILGRLNIPQSFFTSGLFVISVDGASMEPYIHKGAYVGLDTTQRHVSSGELYGVHMPYEGLVIRRIFIDNPNKNLILRAESSGYPEVALPLNEFDSCIAGRVVWVMQRM